MKSRSIFLLLLAGGLLGWLLPAAGLAIAYGSGHLFYSPLLYRWLNPVLFVSLEGEPSAIASAPHLVALAALLNFLSYMAVTALLYTLWSVLSRFLRFTSRSNA